MATHDDSGDTSAMGTIRFLDGRVAHGSEERIKAITEKQAAWDAQAKRNSAIHFNKRHPEGLAQIKSADGAVVRKGGTRPWLEA